jgi:hypothetical protein
MPLSFVKTPFFKRLILKQNPCMNFPLNWVLGNEILPRMVEMTKEMYSSQPLNLVIIV